MVTLRDADGVIVDLFRAIPVRFDDGAAEFEVFLLGRRSGATAADARLVWEAPLEDESDL